jgi:hypothetical protein
MHASIFVRKPVPMHRNLLIIVDSICENYVVF